MSIWDYATGQEYVRIESVEGDKVERLIAEIPLTCPDAETIAEKICMEHNCRHSHCGGRTMNDYPKKPIEYEFTLSDGSKRYEFIDPDAGTSVMRQVAMFMEMHGAIAAKPLSLNPQVRKETAEEPTPVETESHDTFTTGGSWGKLICDITTGNVIKYDRCGYCDDDDEGYSNITRLDADEWRRTYPEGDIAAGHDILDFGSWDKDGVYVGPEEDWRFNLWYERENALEYDEKYRIVPRLGAEAHAKYETWLKEQQGDGDASEAIDFLNRRT